MFTLSGMPEKTTVITIITIINSIEKEATMSIRIRLDKRFIAGILVLLGAMVSAPAGVRAQVININGTGNAGNDLVGIHFSSDQGDHVLFQRLDADPDHPSRLELNGRIASVSAEGNEVIMTGTAEVTRITPSGSTADQDVAFTLKAVNGTPIQVTLTLPEGELTTGVEPGQFEVK